MAEARQAVAFQFAITDEGVSLHFDKGAVKRALGSFFRGHGKRVLRLRAAIYSGVFPASPVSLAVILALVTGLWLAGYNVSWGALPTLLSVSRYARRETEREGEREREREREGGRGREGGACVHASVVTSLPLPFWRFWESRKLPAKPSLARPLLE